MKKTEKKTTKAAPKTTTKKTSAKKHVNAAPAKSTRKQTALSVVEASINHNRNHKVPVASLKKLTVKRGLGRVLSFINENPNLKPSQITEQLGYKSHRCNLFSTLRWGGLVTHANSHYVITPLGQRLLKEAGI